MSLTWDPVMPSCRLKQIFMGAKSYKSLKLQVHNGNFDRPELQQREREIP